MSAPQEGPMELLPYTRCKRSTAAARMPSGSCTPIRGSALSGRMWQAPLNGCRVYSEALPPGVALPGVSITDSYSEIVEPLLPVTCEQRERLANEAATYWQEDASRIATELGLTMADVPQKRLDHFYWR